MVRAADGEYMGKNFLKKGGIRYAIRVELILLLALGCVAMSRELTDKIGRAHV